jgi:RNA polymerase sigma-70 factor (family 1)
VQVIDNQIFDAVKTGDETAFEQLFRTFYPRLCGFAATLVTDREEAEEVVQTLFCRLWEQRDTLEVTTSVQAYLFRAVRNASLNHLKKVKIRDTYKAHNLAIMEQNHEFQPDYAVHSELRQALEKAIAGLPEQCRIIFKMSRFEELKYKEIADKLGISPKTVENQMGKALKVLRLQMVDFLTITGLLIIIFGKFISR